MPQPKDDLRHPLAPGPHSRESLFYGVLLPDEDLMVFTYTWVDPEGRAGYLFTVTADADERRVFHAEDKVPVGDRDFDDWAVGGVTVRHVDPLVRSEVGFEADDVSFRAEFEGVHPAFSYLDSADGCPSFIADDRFEQSCRARGTLVLGGREIAFDTMGYRDHSWGDRDWRSIQDWKWMHAQAGPDLAVHLMTMHARGRTTLHGYVFRDGTLSPVVGARGDATYDDRWWQTGGDFTLEDAAGRTTRVTAERFAFFRFEAGGVAALNEAGCRGTIDGDPALVHLECGWDPAYQADQADRARERIAAAAG